MSTYQKKGSTIYTMDFWFGGTRIKESTGVRTKAMADRVERARRTSLEEGRAGVSKPKVAQMFSTVAEEYLETATASLTPGETRGRAATVRIDRQNLVHLVQGYGKLLLCDITPLHVANYQKKRLAAGAAPTTINNEMGTFRSVMTESGNWARLLPKVNMLEVDYEIGRCLTPAQIEAVLEACISSESRLLYPMVMLQLETGSRSGTVISLQWKDVDFEGQGLRWGRDKTKSGTGRTVPISQRAMAVLEVWAENFPKRKPDHFVFPSDRYKQPKKSERGKVNPYTADPTRHVISVRHAWLTALEKASWILAGRPESMKEIEPFHCRFHDLRHTACTRMMEAKIPIPVIAQLVGWSPTTMWEMARKYGHFSQDAMREAVESISLGGESPLKSHPYNSQQWSNPS
jgi:integrase